MPRRWMLGRNQELTTVAQDTSIMRTHVLPPWHNTSVAKIDYTSVQQWITEISQERSAATVHERFRLLSSALRAAVHDRLISTTPCEGIRLPKRRRKDTDERTISRQAFGSQLLPNIPHRYRALVALSGGTGMRWGECIGLRWDAVDLDNATARVTVHTRRSRPSPTLTVLSTSVRCPCTVR